MRQCECRGREGRILDGGTFAIWKRRFKDNELFDSVAFDTDPPEESDEIYVYVDHQWKRLPPHEVQVRTCITRDVDGQPNGGFSVIVAFGHFLGAVDIKKFRYEKHGVITVVFGIDHNWFREAIGVSGGSMWIEGCYSTHYGNVDSQYFRWMPFITGEIRHEMGPGAIAALGVMNGL